MSSQFFPKLTLWFNRRSNCLPLYRYKVCRLGVLSERGEKIACRCCCYHCIRIERLCSFVFVVIIQQYLRRHVFISRRLVLNLNCLLFCFCKKSRLRKSIFLRKSSISYDDYYKKDDYFMILVCVVSKHETYFFDFVSGF